jgi:phosphoribosyl 1,2-cyclic phosphodiesterase
MDFAPLPCEHAREWGFWMGFMVDETGPRDSTARPGNTVMRVTFWGTRGSIPCSGLSYLRYGGSTSCVELRCGDHLMVFDGGSGIRNLGEQLIDDPPGLIDIFLSHCHFDHVCGLPFFAPFHLGSVRLRLWGGRFDDGLTTEAMLASFMMPPFFPVTPDVFRAAIEYRDFRAGDTLHPATGIEVETVRLHHPQGATGYGVSYRGAKVCYLTDTEAGPGGLDPEFVRVARRADILIADSMFTDAELSACAGWGHQSWRQAIELADAAEVRTLVLFHHHPMHDDTFMDAVAREARAMRPDVIVARENLTLEV